MLRGHPGHEHQHHIFDSDNGYKVCDGIIDQYKNAYGSVTAYRDRSLAMAQRDGNRVMFALNVLDGGVQDREGNWDCTGAGQGGKGTYAPNCRMTPDQVRDWGWSSDRPDADCSCGGMTPATSPIPGINRHSGTSLRAWRRHPRSLARGHEVAGARTTGRRGSPSGRLAFLGWNGVARQTLTRQLHSGCRTVATPGVRTEPLHAGAPRSEVVVDCLTGGRPGHGTCSPWAGSGCRVIGLFRCSTTFFRCVRSMRTLVGLLTFAWLGLSVPAAAQESNGSGSSMLTPGDSVRIVVWRKPEFSGDFVVAPDGSITHPLYRSVKVAGVPYATAEVNLRRFLSGFEENPQFVMEPLVRVAVSGEVSRPQLYALRPETTIGEAVARAGGASEEGAPDRTRVLRIDASGRQQQFVVDLTNPEAGAGTFQVRSGDQIIIPERKSFFRNVLLPALGVIGSVASLGLLIDRYSRD